MRATSLGQVKVTSSVNILVYRANQCAFDLQVLASEARSLISDSDYSFVTICNQEMSVPEELADVNASTAK